MGEKVIAEIWVAVNEDGGYEVGKDESDAGERLTDNEGGCHCRMVKMMVDITAVVPAPIEVTAALPEREDGSFDLVLSQA